MIYELSISEVSVYHLFLFRSNRDVIIHLQDFAGKSLRHNAEEIVKSRLLEMIPDTRLYRLDTSNQMIRAYSTEI